MTKRLFLLIFLAAFSFVAIPSRAMAQSRRKPAPLTGTWSCQAHGVSKGDVPFTLYLEQSGEDVTGSVTSPLGDTDLASATFKRRTLEIHISADDSEYLLTAKFAHGELKGNWSYNDTHGTWEGKKATSKE